MRDAPGIELVAVADPDAEARSKILDLEGGTPVLYEGDWATREPETSWNGEWEIVGEEGRLLWSGDTDDRSNGELSLERWGEVPVEVEQPGLEFVERDATLQALRSAIEDGQTPETGAADNVRSLAVMLGCVRSIEEGEPVSVAWMYSDAEAERDPDKR